MIDRIDTGEVLRGRSRACMLYVCTVDGDNGVREGGRVYTGGNRRRRRRRRRRLSLLVKSRGILSTQEEEEEVHVEHQVVKVAAVG